MAYIYRRSDSKVKLCIYSSDKNSKNIGKHSRQKYMHAFQSQLPAGDKIQWNLKSYYKMILWLILFWEQVKSIRNLFCMMWFDLDFIFFHDFWNLYTFSRKIE